MNEFAEIDMTIGHLGHHPLEFINDGWNALKDRAHLAITHFAPAEETSAETSDSDPESKRQGSWGVVATDLVARDNEVEVRCEIPGMNKNDIQVRIHGGRITIEGEKRVDDHYRDGDMVVTERAFGRFQRSILLPSAVVPDKATAVYEGGVLTVKIPRDVEAKENATVTVK